MESRRCLCIIGYKSDNAQLFEEGVMYRVIGCKNMYNFYLKEYEICYEMVSDRFMCMGYVSKFIFLIYFQFELDIIIEVDIIFNLLMDGGRL